MSNRPQGFIDAEQVKPEQNAQCQYKCSVVKDHMISCGNVEFGCMNIAHTQCIRLKEEHLPFVSIWFCNTCRQQEEYNRRWLVEENKVKQIESIADARSASIAYELDKVLDELEEKSAQLSAANQAVEQLAQELSHQSSHSNAVPSAQNTSSQSTSSRVEEILQRARNRLHRRESNVVFNLNANRSYISSTPRANDVEDSRQQQKYATMIAEAANAYPDYEMQEAEADKLSAEQLALLRSHITDPQSFSGDVATWATFKTVFVGSSRRGHFRAIEDMERLRRLIGGDAARMYGPEIMEPFAHPTVILKKLDNFYGLKGNAVRHHLQTICHLPRIDKVSNREAILNLFASVKTYALLCRQYNQTSELTAESTLLLIEGRMHDEHITSWRNWAAANNYVIGVDAIIAFLEDQLRQIQQNIIVPQISKSKTAHGHVFTASVVTGGQAEPSASTSESSTSKKGGRTTRKRKHKCFHCKEEHYYYECPKFFAMAAEERMETTKSLKICLKCLKVKRHKAVNCPAEEVKCPVANCQVKNRHPLLHGHTNEQLKELSVVAMHRVLTVAPRKIKPVLFKVIPGQVIAADGQLIPITVLFDCASSLSLSEMSLLRRAGWESERYELSMKWTSDIIRTEVNAYRHNVKFVPQGRKTPVLIEGITAIDNLDLPSQSQDVAQLKKCFPYLGKIPLPSYSRQKPQILLGLTHLRLMSCLQSVRDPSGNGPVAELCELGWTISGPCESILGIETMQDPNVVGYSCIHTSSVGEDESVDVLIELIKQFFAQDSTGIKSKQAACLSVEDKRALEIIENTMRFIPEAKRYEIGLLWKYDNVAMPYNFEMAFNRLKAAESRLKKLDLTDFMKKQFREEIQSGQLVKVHQEELKKAKIINFVPGFVVFNRNKHPPKPRWVNDTAAECQKVSLNSRLLKGPDNLVPLPQVLFILREGAIALTADVKKMFNQIMLKYEDQFAQLCLWRDCDSSKEVSIYRQTRVIFGPACSPAAANAVRIRHAENSMTKYPRAAVIARDQMYMDDVTDSCENLEEAVRTAKELIEMFDEISWELTQFQSNSPELLEQLPRDRVSDKMIDLSIEEMDLQITKVLGMFWDPKKDVFKFKLNDEKLLHKCLTENYHPTRREMISLVMRLFDPLGLLSHFLVHGRLVLQEMCRHGLDWKDRVPDDIFTIWSRWIKLFDQIASLEIPRRYAPVPLSESEITMHLFVDASKEAYACAIYLRVENNAQVYVQLIAAKARVAPIKHMSIPKLELNSALIGARLLVSAKEWLKRLNIKSYVAWSDSITVLRWLYARHIRYKQYVAPRVAEIQELTAVKSWRYVPSEENVADIATKWHDIDFADKDHVWFRGPKFLYKPPQEWPKLPEDFGRYLTDEFSEDKVERVMISRKLGDLNPWQAGIINGVTAKNRANWHVYTRIVALSLRFYDAMRSKSEVKKSRVLSPFEWQRAEDYIVRSVQRAAFAEEYKLLQRGKQLPTSSKLTSLMPFVCNKGIIRVRTRLSDSFPYDTRYPRIMPNLHETTDAIVNYFHCKNNHVGDNVIAGAIRTSFWIINTRRAVKRVRARCLYCLEKRAKPEMPEEGGLPEFRLDATKKPFFYTGVDCFGPFEVYSNRSRHKKNVWMIIFTCLITRAVYLEVIDEMSTDCMYMALEKLWARRGPIGHMYSDNGRNFVGMANLLENEAFQVKLADKRLTWHFQPPYAPNFGGAWERLIKDIKRALVASVVKFPVPRIALESILAQIESNMNNRPLTDIAVSPHDLEPLTPNLLMQGHNNYPVLSDHDITLEDLVSKKYIRCAKAVVQAYMKRWTLEVLPEIARHKITKKPKFAIKQGDIVIYIDPTKPPHEWRRGKVERIYPGRDKKARVADVRIGNELLERRAVSRLAKLDFRLENPQAEQNRYQSNKNLTVDTDSNQKVKKSPQVILHTQKFMEEKNKKMSASSLNFQLQQPAKGAEISSPSTKFREDPIGVLSEEEREKYLNPRQDRVVYASCLPKEAGVIELWQALRAFGQINTIVVPYWSGITSFYAFVIFNRPQAAIRALQNSRSMAIGINGKYNRVVFEKPLRKIKPLDNRRISGLERMFISIEDGTLTAKVMVVRQKQPDMTHRTIPTSSDYQIVRRQLDSKYKYKFIVFETDCEEIRQLARVKLPYEPRLSGTLSDPDLIETAAISQVAQNEQGEEVQDTLDEEDTIVGDTPSLMDSEELETAPTQPGSSRQLMIISHQDAKHIRSIIHKPSKKKAARKCKIL